MAIFEPAPYVPPTGLEAMVRMAYLEPVALLAETSSALLLVDVQNRFLYHGSEDKPAPTASVVEPIERLLGSARSQDVPCVYVTGGHAPGGMADAAPWLWRLAVMGADVTARLRGPVDEWQAAIPASIAPRAGEVHLTKWRYSAFYETGLEMLLRGGGIETVVIGGVASYGCIIATYIDAACRGFFPLICTEAVDGADPTLHRAAMDFMASRSMINVDDVIRIWSEQV